MSNLIHDYLVQPVCGICGERATQKISIGQFRCDKHVGGARMLIATFLVRVPKGYRDSGLHAEWMRVRSRLTSVEEVRAAVAKMNDAVLILSSIHTTEVEDK